VMGKRTDDQKGNNWLYNRTSPKSYCDKCTKIAMENLYLEFKPLLGARDKLSGDCCRFTLLLCRFHGPNSNSPNRLSDVSFNVSEENMVTHQDELHQFD